MKTLIKENHFAVISLVILIFLCCCQFVPAATLSGFVRFNGSVMSNYTSATPTFQYYDYDTQTYYTPPSSYNSSTGAYTLYKLPEENIAVLTIYHLQGTHSTLPNNYRGLEGVDIPSLSPIQLANFSLDVEMIMHMTDPWDNENIDFYTYPTSPYPVHGKLILFDWDLVPTAQDYRFVIQHYRDPNHPSGYGYIDTVYDYSGLLATSYTVDLDLPDPQTHYEVYVEAYNASDVRIGYYMTTYKNGYGWDYRFKVREYENVIWYVDEDAAGAQLGTSWYHAFRHLQDALAVAEAGDEIWVADGIYYPDESMANPSGTNDRSATFTMIQDVDLYGGFNGTEDDLSERNWIENETILSGDIGSSSDTDNSYHVVTCSIGSSNTATLDGFQIVDGNADGNTYPQWIGAGLYLSSGNPYIQNCKFMHCNATYGGAIADWGYGQPQIVSCWFIENTATSRGGGVELQHSGAILRGCIFLGNTSASSGGGLYAINNASQPELYNCVFSGNTAVSSGGAIRQAATDGDNEFAPVLYNCTLANNSAGGQAGGIYNSGSTAITLNSCILWDNTDSSGSNQESQFYTTDPTPSIDYSCIQGWNGSWGGTGNIGLFPMFIDDDGVDDTFGTKDDNYRLMEGSPCINTGDPSASMNDPDGSRNDMGAYGGPWSDLSLGPGTIIGSGFVFTTIGDIPTAFITQSDSNPDLLQGTANVSSTDAANFHIPAYTNSPFGSSIRIRGMFGSEDNVDYYKVQAGMWDGDTPPSESDFFDLTDTLYKTYTYYNTSLNEWISYSYKIGPLTVEGLSNVYYYTSVGFWSNLDLRMVWNTRSRPNGKFTLRIKGYAYISGGMNDVTPVNAQELILLVDNSPMTCVIHNVKYDPSSPYYNPVTDGEILECSIISLQDVQENLRFNVTASHSNGHLRTFILDTIAGKNDHRGTIASLTYNPADGPYWHGVTEETFNSVDALPPSGNLENWKRCAYQFRLRTWSKVTNGYHYIYYKEFNDHYFIDLGGIGTCERADIDGSGTVDLQDFAAMSSYWLETCPLNP